MRLRLLKFAMIAVLPFLASPLVAQDKKSKKNKDAVAPAAVLSDSTKDLWRTVDPDNLVYMDLPAGLVLIELRPDFAPGHVERIKELVSEGFYDGLSFHRVIEGFMAQGGDPKGDGTGGSSKPNLKGEFIRDSKDVEGFVEIGRDRSAPRIGFVDGMPTAAQPEGLRSFRTDGGVDAWGMHCPGVMSMARANDPNSANSQFFLMIGDARSSLDRRYSTWGWIVDGFEATRRITRGEPPSRPTKILRVRLSEDVPESERHKVEVFRTESPEFLTYLKIRGDVSENGFVNEACDIVVPRKIDGAVER